MTGNPYRKPARVVLLIASSLLFGTAGVRAQASDTAGPTSGRIILIEPKKPDGALKVKQGKRVSPINAFEGMLVRRGYVLILRPTARAAVLCGDGKKRELAPGPQGCPCTKACTPEVCGIRYDGSTIVATRGPDTENGTFPVVIAPRKTMLLNLRPTIRWTPAAGSNKSTVYKVSLYGDGKAIWSREVISETSLAYPDKESPLLPGRTYKVVITSDGVSSEQDRSPGLGFTTLTTNQARALADEELKRKLMQLPETQTRFLVSNLYAARELYCEAIEQLEDLRSKMKEPAVARTLGDLYTTIGLNRQAENEYLEALSLTPSNDLEGVGAIQRSLAQVYEGLGIYDRAIESLDQAIEAYRRLSNNAMIQVLLNEQRSLKRAGRHR